MPVLPLLPYPYIRPLIPAGNQKARLNGYLLIDIFRTHDKVLEKDSWVLAVCAEW
jgi:hypothetical protein